MIRPFQSSDAEQIKRIHIASGIDWEFPDINGPLFFIRRVCEVDGKVVAALTLRACAETSLWLDQQRGPQEKMQIMRDLQASVLEEAYKNGLDEVYASIPDSLGFSKRLVQLGWLRDRPGWALWSRSTHAISGKPSQ